MSMTITIKTGLSSDTLRAAFKDIPNLSVKPIKNFKGCYYHFLESHDPADFFVAGQRIGEAEGRLKLRRESVSVSQT